MASITRRNLVTLLILSSGFIVAFAVPPLLHHGQLLQFAIHPLLMIDPLPITDENLSEKVSNIFFASSYLCDFVN